MTTAAIILSLTVAAGLAGAPASNPGPVAHVQPAGGSLTITLLEPGAEPRRPIRLAPEINRTQVVTVSTRATLKTTRDGDRLAPETPGATLTLNVTPTSIGRDGVATIETLCRTAQPIGDVGDDERRVLDSLIGIRVISTVDGRGVSRGVELSGTDAISAEARRAVDRFSRAIDRLGVIFPEEPVGVGARWRIVERVASGGVSIVQTTLFTLERFDGRTAVTSATIEQTADAQPIDVAGMGDATAAQLVSLTSTGTSRIVHDLAAAAPVDATSTLNTSINLTVTRAAGVSRVAQELSVTTNASQAK